MVPGQGGGFSQCASPDTCSCLPLAFSRNFLGRGENVSQKKDGNHCYFGVLAWRIPGMGDLVGCLLWGLIDVNNTTDPFRFGFFVPENVYIIGTMNDIDRSVESMDFAMRRRFTFVEFTACEHLGMLNKIDDYDTKKLAEVKMKALNDAIVNPQIGGLTQSYQIGGSYFVHVNDFKDSDDKWEDLWEYHLKGLIFEYFRGIPDASDKLKSLKEVFKKATIKKQ